MERLLSESERIYEKVSKFMKILPSHIVASFRVTFSNPKMIDSIKMRIRIGCGQTAIEHKEGWRYSFMYGEKEFNELLRQML